MIGIIGKKLGMTQIFNEQGQQIPCTVVEAEPNPVVEGDRTRHEPASRRWSSATARSGSRARVDEGREERRSGRRATQGRGRARGEGWAATRAARRCAAFRLDDGRATQARDPDVQGRRQRSTSAIFAPGEQVKVTGTSKGRGFQGVVKRYGFGGGPNTHGNTKHRRPGSIGPGTDPSRVIKGKKMPGHYGDERHTQTHLRVEKIDAERNLIYIRGAVAGPTNGIVARPQAGLSHG